MERVLSRQEILKRRRSVVIKDLISWLSQALAVLLPNSKPLRLPDRVSGIDQLSPVSPSRSAHVLNYAVASAFHIVSNTGLIYGGRWAV